MGHVLNSRKDEKKGAVSKQNCEFQESCKKIGTRLSGACFTGGVTLFKGKKYPCFTFKQKKTVQGRIKNETDS